MKTKNVLLIASSAVLFNLALLFPERLSFFVFIFLVPIFYVVFNEKKILSFKVGFMWGFIFFSIHFSGFVFFFYNYANVKLSVFIPFILSTYCAIYAGVWFLCASKMSLMLYNSNFAKYGSWFLWTYLYFAWIRYGALWIFGTFIGYPFSYPLIPLAHSAKTLYFLGYFGKSVLFIFVILFSLFAALFFSTLKKRYFLFSFFIFSPFLLSTFLTEQTKVKNKDVNKIGYISPIDSQKYDYPLDAAQAIYYNMVKLIECNPGVKIIVMPESSYNFCLNEHQEIIDLWYANILDSDIHFFIGAPYKNDDEMYNALYWICGGQIEKVYNKINLMAFTEYVAGFWTKIPYMRELFSQEYSFFSLGKSRRIIFHLCQNNIFRPLICSDFFIGKRSDRKFLKKDSFTTTLLVVNDEAMPTQYLRDLMFLSAKLEVINRKKDMLYVGYYFAALISKNGSVIVI